MSKPATFSISKNKVSFSNPANSGVLKNLARVGFYINIKISKDTEIQKLNKKYFGRDYPTDVLSFNLNKNNPSNTSIQGEIIVNYDQAERQASQYGNTVEMEIADLVAHGVLHLLDVHHPDDDNNSIHGVPNKEVLV